MNSKARRCALIDSNGDRLFMKKRSDMNLSRETKSSAHIHYTPKKSSDIASHPPVYSYLPFDFSRQLFTGIDALESSKCSLSSLANVRNDEFKSSFAYRMTAVILYVIDNEGCVCDNEGCCVDAFYASCVVRYLSMYDDVNDRDLLVIFAKQIMIMLKHSGAVSVSEGGVSCSAGIHESVYMTVFNAFWNGVSWSRLFPSMPQVADVFQEDRYILVEMLSSREGLFSVEDLARDYYSIMPVPCDDIMLYVSFFDYSFFSWMSHFGIIRYSSDEGKVRAELTGWGRNFLAILE